MCVRLALLFCFQCLIKYSHLAPFFLCLIHIFL
uniref:Uncharacterized protein n=1 Tax=Timema poppense TaxID=170557 RepID=A0A7R9H359_TIMPO|nr:unnamed protein product [Timema poppensis]